MTETGQDSPRRPRWYRQMPVLVPLLVSVLALLFSFWSTYRSEDRLERQERHEANVELRGLIQRLQELPKENVELLETYADNPTAQSQIGGLLNTENLILGQQAVELIEELEGDVTAAEYFAAATALSNSNQYQDAERLLAEGLGLADDPLIETSLLRAAAGARFLAGDLDAGRDLWQRALDVFQRYPTGNASFVAYTNAYTEVSWATAELGAGQCREAWQHILAAEPLAAELGALNNIGGQRDAVESQIAAACGRG